MDVLKSWVFDENRQATLTSFSHTANLSFKATKQLFQTLAQEEGPKLEVVYWVQSPTSVELVVKNGEPVHNQGHVYALKAKVDQPTPARLLELANSLSTGREDLLYNSGEPGVRFRANILAENQYSSLEVSQEATFRPKVPAIPASVMVQNSSSKGGPAKKKQKSVTGFFKGGNASKKKEVVKKNEVEKKKAVVAKKSPIKRKSPVKKKSPIKKKTPSSKRKVIEDSSSEEEEDDASESSSAAEMEEDDFVPAVQEEDEEEDEEAFSQMDIVQKERRVPHEYDEEGFEEEGSFSDDGEPAPKKIKVKGTNIVITPKEQPKRAMKKNKRKVRWVCNYLLLCDSIIFVMT